MVSFLAALTGGVSFEDEQTRRVGTASDRDREAAGRIRVPAIGSLLGFDASGRMTRREKEEDSEEVRAVRQHTAASLFNALHEALYEERLVTRVTPETDLDSVSPGDLVEITGDFAGNPLQEILSFMTMAFPYYLLSDEGEALQQAQQLDLNAVQARIAELQTQTQQLRANAAQAQRSGNPSKRAQAADLNEQAEAAELEAQTIADQALHVLQAFTEWQQKNRGVAMMGQMRDELANSAVHDAVLTAGEITAVLTLASEFFTDTTRAYLRAGVFSVIGKVTRVLEGDATINLLRRTVLGAAGPEFGRELIESSTEVETIKLETFDPIIGAPALQILPVAVYV